MILLSSQMDLYFSLRNVCLVLFAVFVLISIIYGVRVHILTTIQKHFGIEKRREMAKRREGGYKAGNTTARMRYMQQANARPSGAMWERHIDVSQVKTEKMQQAMAINPVGANMEGTVPLSQGNGDTTVLSQGNEDTIVLSQGNEDTMVLSQGNEDTIVLSQGNGDTTVLSQGNQDTVVLAPVNQDTVVLAQGNQDTVVLSPTERVIIRMQRNIVVVHGDDII